MNRTFSVASSDGGTFEVQFTERDQQLASILIGNANEYAGRKLIVGQSNRGFWKKIRRGSVIKTILRCARHMDGSGGGRL
jgi:two-component system sensor histidine kinase KdpD